MYIHSYVKRLGSLLLSVAIGLFLVFGLAACDEITDALDDDEDDPDRFEGINLLEPAGSNIHDDFAAVAEQVPDFGGFFFDEDGHPNVYLLEPAPDRADEVREALESVFGDDVLERGSSERRPVDDPQLELLGGNYGMPDLLTWFDELHEVFAVDEVVFVDLYERENELTVAVDDRNAFEEVEAILQELDIPREAIDLKVTEPIDLQSHTLRSNISPPLGGIQIHSGGECTFGFIAGLEGQVGFATNSHCTDELGTVTGTTFNQPVAGNQIGTEAVDPDFESCGFLGLRSCRYSDAAFVEYEDDIELPADGGIARPETWAGPGGDTAGPLEIDHGSPSLTIEASMSAPIGGEMLDKIGQRTGWTYGFVNRTCMTGRPSDDGERVEVDGDKVAYRCQDRASYHSDDGDSGSPVFKWHGDTVTVYGIHWGSGGIFSAVWNIRKDFSTN